MLANSINKLKIICN